MVRFQGEKIDEAILEQLFEARRLLKIAHNGFGDIPL